MVFWDPLLVVVGVLDLDDLALLVVLVANRCDVSNAENMGGGVMGRALSC